MKIKLSQVKVNLNYSYSNYRTLPRSIKSKQMIRECEHLLHELAMEMRMAGNISSWADLD